MRSREKAIRYARSYSKRHGSVVHVEHVVGGRGKGSFEARHDGTPNLWWSSSVVEIVATYENGHRRKD